jgi:hypothetical protein
MEVTVDADPALFRPGKGPRSIAEFKPDLAYQVCLRNVSRVLVSDAQGRTDQLFGSQSGQTIRAATYEFVGPDLFT